MPPRERDPGPCLQFTQHIDERKKLYTGLDFSDKLTHFIPEAELKNYWTTANIDAVLRAQNPPVAASIDVIRKQFLRTFSTLVYANRVQFYHEFTAHGLNDEHLPLDSFPAHWADGPIYQDLYRDFAKHQWLFFPLRLAPDQVNDRTLDDGFVLPITSKIKIKKGDASTVYKIQVDNSCNHLVPQVCIIASLQALSEG